MKSILVVALVLLAGCSDLATSPKTLRAMRDDVCLIPTDGCDRTPVVDSISPDFAGRAALGDPSIVVTVYGKNLDGGVVYLGDSAVGSPFTAPTRPGTYAVTVSTIFGESNTVFFTRE